jgi:acetolactate synthase-1/3 small subunit
MAKTPAGKQPKTKKEKPPLPPASAYFIEERHDRLETHTLSVLVDNEPGVLARVIGLFSGRGYNIDSLTVSETEHERHLSRITIVTRGTPHVLEQIKNQLERIVPVHRVVDLTVVARERGQERPLVRELAMVKVAGTGDNRVEALRLADAFRAQVIDANTEHFIFEITGRVSKIEQFISIMKPLGVVEVCRTGVAAMNRGVEKMWGGRQSFLRRGGSRPCSEPHAFLDVEGIEERDARVVARRMHLRATVPAHFQERVVGLEDDEGVADVRQEGQGLDRLQPVGPDIDQSLERGPVKRRAEIALALVGRTI